MTKAYKIETTIGDVTVTGEIFALYTNDLTVRLVGPADSPAVGACLGLHIPHFKMAYKQHWVADQAGNLSEYGRQRAIELLVELYTQDQTQTEEP